MGKLIKNHWARLIILSAATCMSLSKTNRRGVASLAFPRPRSLTPFADQVAAAIEAFFWPKIFFDFLTKTLDPAVKPFPVLQILNLVLGIIMLLWEWPLGLLAGSALHRSLEARLAALPLVALAAALLYQGTNAAIYYLIGMVVYFWAYSEAEVRGSLPLRLPNAVLRAALVANNRTQIICPKPWTLPQRRSPRSGAQRV